MSTFATAQDVAAYVEGWQTTDAFALERLIQRAEITVDRLLMRRRLELPPTQVISLGSASQVPSVGAYTLGFQGVDTASLAFNAPASSVQAALVALPAIGSDSYGVPNALVLGSNPYTVVWSTDWARTNFVGRSAPVLSGGIETYPEDYYVPLLTVDNSTLNVPATVVEVPGRKLNPFTDIDRNQQLALARATSYQVEYRVLMGEKFFMRPQYDSVGGPDFTTKGKLPRLAPKAKEELTGVGLLHVQGRAYAGWPRRGVARGWATY